jgi:hypothetical protein
MPTTKQRISINLSESEYAELSALAEAHSLSMAWIGHKAILNFMEQYRGESLQLPLSFAKRPAPLGGPQIPSENGPILKAQLS